MAQLDLPRANAALSTLRAALESLRYAAPEMSVTHLQRAADAITEIADALGLMQPRACGPVRQTPVLLDAANILVHHDFTLLAHEVAQAARVIAERLAGESTR